jgi:hypothetical protein
MQLYETISTKFKGFTFCWVLGITGVMINYSLATSSEESHANLIWEGFMYIFLIGAWGLLLFYLIIWLFTIPSYSTLICLKLTFLALSGPYLLGLSFYAFYQRINMQVYVYAVSFLVWWLFFSVAVYSSFKLALELLLILQRHQKRKRMLEHYRSINMQSIS